MQIGLRRISSESVEWFKKSCLSGGPGRPSRSAIVRELCERENWRGTSGELCSASARKLLPKLAAELGAELPKPCSRPEGANRRPEADYPDKALACGLASLGEVSLDPVPDGERRSWGSMVESHHPKGRAAPRAGGFSTGSARRGTGFSAAGPSPPQAAN